MQGIKKNVFTNKIIDNNSRLVTDDASILHGSRRGRGAPLPVELDLMTSRVILKTL